MTHTINEDKVSSLRRQIGALEWDVRIVKDKDTAKRKNATLSSLRSELKVLIDQSENVLKTN